MSIRIILVQVALVGRGHPLLLERVRMASARFESLKPQKYKAIISINRQREKIC